MSVLELMAETFGAGEPDGRVSVEAQDAEILRALAAGSSPQDIADEWGVSRWLVYKRVERVRTRLGVATTTQAVLAAAWMRAEGLL